VFFFFFLCCAPNVRDLSEHGLCFGMWCAPQYQSLTQILGALLAGFVTYGIADEVTYPNPDGSNGLFNSFVFETLFAVAWIMVVLCVATPTSDLEAEDGLDEKAPQSFYGLAIGLTVASGARCWHSTPRQTLTLFLFGGRCRRVLCWEAFGCFRWCVQPCRRHRAMCD